MHDYLNVPDDFQHLIEKREQDRRRERGDDEPTGAPPEGQPERRRNLDRRSNSPGREEDC